MRLENFLEIPAALPQSLLVKMTVLHHTNSVKFVCNVRNYAFYILIVTKTDDPGRSMFQYLVFKYKPANYGCNGISHDQIVISMAYHMINHDCF